MAYVVMAYKVMAYIVMADRVMASLGEVGLDGVEQLVAKARVVLTARVVNRSSALFYVSIDFFYI